jgi:hypothetical protein
MGKKHDSQYANFGWLLTIRILAIPLSEKSMKPMQFQVEALVIAQTITCMEDVSK